MLKIRFERKWNWNWNRDRAIMWWIITSIAFGPFQLLIYGTSYKGAIIFSNNPPAYFVLFGISVASLSVAIVYLVDLIIRRNAARSS